MKSPMFAGVDVAQRTLDIALEGDPQVSQIDNRLGPIRRWLRSLPEGCAIGATYIGFAEGAQAVVETARSGGVDADSVQLDQRDEASIEACAHWVIDRFGRCDILVNNAAWNIGIPFADLEALTPEIWDRVHETNLRGPFLLSRLFASELRRHKAGRIINIASLAGLAPGGSSIAYAASKAGLIHLTHCMAVALAPDVTVNCIAPGLVEGAEADLVVFDRGTRWTGDGGSLRTSGWGNPLRGRSLPGSVLLTVAGGRLAFEAR